MHAQVSAIQSRSRHAIPLSRCSFRSIVESENDYHFSSSFFKNVRPRVCDHKILLKRKQILKFFDSPMINVSSILCSLSETPVFLAAITPSLSVYSSFATISSSSSLLEVAACRSASRIAFPKNANLPTIEAVTIPRPDFLIDDARGSSSSVSHSSSKPKPATHQYRH